MVPAVRPDFAVIQASEIDAQGNVRVSGTAHWDRIMSRAAGSVLVVPRVDSAVFEAQPESTLVPYSSGLCVGVLALGRPTNYRPSNAVQRLRPNGAAGNNRLRSLLRDNLRAARTFHPSIPMPMLLLAARL